METPGPALFLEPVPNEEPAYNALSLVSVTRDPSIVPAQDHKKNRGVLCAVIRVRQPQHNGLCSQFLQMIIATSNVDYDQAVAAELLDSFPIGETNAAVNTLIEEKIIHKQSAVNTARFFGFHTR